MFLAKLETLRNVCWKTGIVARVSFLVFFLNDKDPN